MEKRIKIKYFVIVLGLCLLSFLTGLFFNNTKDSDNLIIDFKENEKTNDAYGSDFISSVGLHYLYQKESEYVANFRNYFDTLNYFRNHLYYLNIKDTNYLILYKPTNISSNEPLYGFTKNKFIIYIPHETHLKNYPVGSVERGEDLKEE